MTAPTTSQTGDAAMPQRPDELILTIDGVQTAVPKGTLIIRAAEQLGIAVPRFCLLFFQQPLDEPKPSQ